MAVGTDIHHGQKIILRIFCTSLQLKQAKQHKEIRIVWIFGSKSTVNA